jgi:alkanesulfonate monooxygenase SsuD/methylene tetrahydromethanopterin reductase-like flavin-dependent oxidoreductase (luciferase family)
MVAEEIAWLAARFPDRVGLGVASGSLPADFEVMGVPMDDLTARFVGGLEEVTSLLRGAEDSLISGDPAIRRCAEHQVPLLSAAMSFTAARRSARLGIGMLFESLSPPDRVRQLTDAYHEAGGPGPVVMVRRAWVGPPPSDLQAKQLDVYKSYSTEEAMSHWEGEQLIGADSGAEVAERLAAVKEQAGVDALNIRIHVPGVQPKHARDQIARLGDEVLPALRAALSPSTAKT